MLDLALSVLCSSLIFVIFKLFASYRITVIVAIVTNYFVASAVGFVLSPTSIQLGELVGKPWFVLTIILGVVFILVFNIMAKSSQINGVGVTSVATKMSLVIPVLFTVLYYNDSLTYFQLMGIVLALIAVYLSSTKQKALQVGAKDLWLPALVFVGSGIIDTAIKFIQEDYLQDNEYSIFSTTVFGAAGFTGLITLGINNIRQNKPFEIKNILGGICLGIPNYFSIFFLLRALNNNLLNSASVFTINNVAIVLFSTLLGILLFKEKLSAKNWTGVGMAIISIVLIALL